MEFSWRAERDHQNQLAPDIYQLKIYGTRKANIFTPKFHGCCNIPCRYQLIQVPSDAVFENDIPDSSSLWQTIWKPFTLSNNKVTHIFSNYNLVKATIAIAQLLYAIDTFYETRGDQVSRYGYAAFGLTVAPYAWMSFINLLASLVCPDYPARYLVESNASRKLRKEMEPYSRQHGFPLRHNRSSIQMDGFVGALANEDEVRPVNSPQDQYGSYIFWQYLTLTVGSSFPLTVYVVLSNF